MVDSIIFFKSFYESIKRQSKKNQIELYNALFSFAFYGEEIQVSEKAESVWIVIKPHIEKNIQRRLSGSKGGKVSAEKRAAKSKQTSSKPQPNGNDNVNDNENVNVNDNVNVKDNVNEFADAVFSDDNNTDNISRAESHYKKYINPNPSKSVTDFLQELIDGGMEEECIMAIIDYCRDNNKTNWGYIRTALGVNFKEGILTYDEYVARERERENRAQQQMQAQSQTQTQPPLQISYAPSQNPPKRKNAFHNFEQRPFSEEEADYLYFHTSAGPYVRDDDE